MTKPSTGELPIVQKTYDLIKWYVPILNRLPRDHKFGLGDSLRDGKAIAWWQSSMSY